MNPIAYTNGKVLHGGRFRNDLTVVTSEGRIAHVLDSTQELPAGAGRVDLAGDYLLPGFIDVQVNGGGGVLFNEQTDVEGIRTIAGAHRAFGTTGLLPTLISDELDVVGRGLAAVEEAIQLGVPGVLGIHIEGPFLNVERKGVHDASRIRRLTEKIIASLEPLPNGLTLITLAPETVEPGMISELVRKGFIVSAGHSNATQAQVKQALDRGLRGFTHLYNAMSQLTAREAGVVGQALVDDGSWCGIIADGHHVSAEALELAFRCKGVDKLMLVTDAMPPVGSGQNDFVLMGNPVTVQNGVCVDRDGTLAGTALDMATAVRTMAELTSCSLADACVMASATPAAFLGIDVQAGVIEEGLRADLVIMDDRFQVRSALIGGRGV